MAAALWNDFLIPVLVLLVAICIVEVFFRLFHRHL
jgi:hypothetical protein